VCLRAHAGRVRRPGDAPTELAHRPIRVSEAFASSGFPAPSLEGVFGAVTHAAPRHPASPRRSPALPRRSPETMKTLKLGPPTPSGGGPPSDGTTHQSPLTAKCEHGCEYEGILGAVS
jgi:hypothetical protein